jgi:hypothetical protein
MRIGDELVGCFAGSKDGSQGEGGVSKTSALKKEK